jgi:hypothetical protein
MTCEQEWPGITSTWILKTDTLLVTFFFSRSDAPRNRLHCPTGFQREGDAEQKSNQPVTDTEDE